MGKNDRHFTLLKFRTRIDATEKQLDDVLELNEAQGYMFKMEDDPRVTDVSRVLRRWSFDESRQFINVLRGD